MSSKLPHNEEGSQNGTGESPAAEHAAGGSTPPVEDASRNVSSTAPVSVAADSLATRLSTVVMTPCSDPSLDDDQAAKAFSRQSSSDAKLNQTSDQPAHPGTAAKQDSSNSTADEDQQAATFSEQLSSSGTAAAASPAIGTPVDANTAAGHHGEENPMDATTLAVEDMPLGGEAGAAMASSAAENIKAERSRNEGQARAGTKASSKGDTKASNNGDTKASSNGAGAALVTGLSKNQEYSKSPDLLHRQVHAGADEERISKLICYAENLKADNARKEAEVGRLQKKVQSLEDTVGEHAAALTCLKDGFARMFAQQKRDHKEDFAQMLAEQNCNQQKMHQEFREFVARVEQRHGLRVQDLEQRVETERHEKTRVMNQHHAIQVENRKKIIELQALIEELQKRNEVLTAYIQRYRGQLGLDESDEDWLRNETDTDVSTEGVQETRMSHVPEQDDGQRLQEIAAIQAIVVQQGEQVGDLMSHRAVLMLRIGGSEQCMVLNKKVRLPCHNAFSTANTPASPTATAAYSTGCTETSPVAASVAASVASPSKVRPGQMCIPCSIGGVIRVPIVDCIAAGTQVAQSIGLTVDKLALPCNHVCLHFQIARYFAEGRVAIIPDWSMAAKSLCPLRTMRMAVLDEQLLLDPVLQNPECMWSQQQAIVLDESSSMCVANLHGRALFIADEDMPSSDVLAVNIWYTFRKALEDGRRLPKIDPATGRFNSEFATVTDELFEHICSLCIALFEEAVPDQQLRKNFVKAMRLGNAIGLFKKSLH